jgi:hypothetical protein
MNSTILLGIILVIVAIAFISNKFAKNNRRGNRNNNSNFGNSYHGDSGGGRVDGRTKAKLTRLLGGKQKVIDRLLSQCRIKYPGKPEQWYWEKVLYDLERDRWR